jgi:hypothetical protein
MKPPAGQVVRRITNSIKIRMRRDKKMRQNKINLNQSIDETFLVDWIGGIFIVYANGRRFSAKLVAIEGNHCWFENSQGFRTLIKKDAINLLIPIRDGGI